MSGLMTYRIEDIATKRAIQQLEAEIASLRKSIEANKVNINPAGLPVASESVLGGILVGQTLNISNGVLDAKPPAFLSETISIANGTARFRKYGRIAEMLVASTSLAFTIDTVAVSNIPANFQPATAFTFVGTGLVSGIWAVPILTFNGANLVIRRVWRDDAGTIKRIDSGTITTFKAIATYIV